MKIAIGCDHAGYALKAQLLPWFAARGHEVSDVGTHSEDAVDYPDFARAVGAAVARDEAQRGIIICGSGVGACIAANKLRYFLQRQGAGEPEILGDQGNNRRGHSFKTSREERRGNSPGVVELYANSGTVLMYRLRQFG